MQVADKDESKEVWEHLKLLFSNPSPYHKITLLQSLYGFQLLRDERPTAAFIRLTK